MGAEALAVAEKYRFKNVAISGRFCREDSNLGPSKNSSHLELAPVTSEEQVWHKTDENRYE